jgi:hypothetical protein
MEKKIAVAPFGTESHYASGEITAAVGRRPSTVTLIPVREAERAERFGR